MKLRPNTLWLLAFLLLAGIGLVYAADDVAAARAELRALRKDTLNQLYQLNPQAKREIRAAAGYGVFGSTSAQVLLVGGGGGRGIVRHNLTGRDVFMRVGTVSAGLGLGFKDVRTILVFKHRDVLQKFMEDGWVFSGEAAAVAKSEGKGGDASDAANPLGITVYQLTQTGLIAESTLKGTKYWKDDELN